VQTRGGSDIEVEQPGQGEINLLDLSEVEAFAQAA